MDLMSESDKEVLQLELELELWRASEEVEGKEEEGVEISDDDMVGACLVSASGLGVVLALVAIVIVFQCLLYVSLISAIQRSS